MPTKTEYLAVVQGPAGGGSFFRGHDKEDAARRALKVFESDFKHIYGKLKKGTECPVNIYDVTDLEVRVSEDGCFAGGKQIKLLEVIKITA